MAPPQQQQQRIVAIPFPIPGHINPLLHICKKLLSYGFRITYVSSHENHKAMFKSSAAITKDGIEFVGIADGLPPREEGAHPPSGMEGVKVVLQSTDGMQAAMEKLVEKMMMNNSVSCIISDTFIHWTQDIANKHGFPRVAFSTASATVDLFCLHMRRLRSEGFMPVNTRTTGDKLIEFIPGLPSFSPFNIPLSFFNEHPIIDFITIAYERLLEADWILSSTFQELEDHTIRTLHSHFGAKQYLPVGPFLPDSHISPEDEKSFQDRAELPQKEAACLDWLDSRPASSVLYVSFGSIAEISKEQFLELVAGLEASELSVLAVIRASLVSDLSQDEFDKIAERTRERIHFSSWAPQMHVLRHPAVGGFITHCGWNSTLESVCAGVAMIGWPCLSEQNLNCAFLVEKKLALSLQTRRDGVIDKAVIEEAVRALMNGEEGKEIRRNVGELGRDAKRAVVKGGSSFANLELFAEGLSLKLRMSKPGFEPGTSTV